jgi:lysophospholipase L1-like esterase
MPLRRLALPGFIALYALVVLQNAWLHEEVHIIDLLATFDRLPPQEVENNYFENDGIHLTGEGHKVIALILYQYFIRTGLLEQVMQ